MTQYNSLNIKLSNSQLKKLKSAIKNEKVVVLRLSSNRIGEDETNFPHKLLLANRQVTNLSKPFANKSSDDTELSKTQLSGMVQLGGFRGRVFVSLLKTGLPLMKNVITLLAKSVFISLGLIEAASAGDEGIHKKVLGSGRPLSSAPWTTALIISDDEMRDIIEIVESLEDSDLLLKGVCEIIQNEAKEQKGRFLSMLLGTLGVSLLRNILAGKEKNKAGEGVIVKSVSKETMSKKQDLGIITAGYGNKKRRKTTTKRQGNKNKMDF